MSRYTHEILRVLAESVDPLPGSEIGRRARLGVARLYPALTELEDDGRITSTWEDPDGEWPRRRVYSFVRWRP